MSELCISCNFSVGRRQAVTCDVRGRKQHRLAEQVTYLLFMYLILNAILYETGMFIYLLI